MKKLMLFFAVATAVSFASCCSKKSCDTAVAEVADSVVAEVVEAADSVVEVVDSVAAEVADSVVEAVAE